jgi:putative transposase
MPRTGPWSSARAHISGADDGLVTVRAVLDRIPHFAEMLSTTGDQDFGDLRLAEGSGRLLGTAEFVAGLEQLPADPSRAALQDANPRPHGALLQRLSLGPGVPRLELWQEYVE